MLQALRASQMLMIMVITLTTMPCIPTHGFMLPQAKPSYIKLSGSNLVSIKDAAFRKIFLPQGHGRCKSHRSMLRCGLDTSEAAQSMVAIAILFFYDFFTVLLHHSLIFCLSNSFWEKQKRYCEIMTCST
jgi:hypothetical protein